MTGCKIQEGKPCDKHKPDVCVAGLQCADPSMSGAHCMTRADADKACAASAACTTWGNCSYGSFAGGSCGPASNDDCQASTRCKTQGACTFHEGHCTVSTEAQCRASDECATKGHCTFAVTKGGGFCREAPSDSR